jgi:hypothetical protein
MFFDSASSLPSLYICRAENLLGRVPLMPCYISRNAHPTLPHRFGDRVRRRSGDEKSAALGKLLWTRMLWEMNEEKMLWYIPWYIRIYISFNIP